MPHRSIDNVLAELRGEQHLPLVKLVSDLSVLPWARTLRYNLSMFRLWIARKNVGRVEVMVTYAEGRGHGGERTDLELDAYEVSVFEAGAIVKTVTLSSHDSIEYIGKWLIDANLRLSRVDQERLANEAEMSIIQLTDAWLGDDKRACELLADRLSNSALICLATSGLAACSQVVGVVPVEIAEVIHSGSSPQRWSSAHKAFDQVRCLTLVAEQRGAQPKDPSCLLLSVAENASRVIYNASLPRDPFDDDAAESLLRALVTFCKMVSIGERGVIVGVIKSCLAKDLSQ